MEGAALRCYLICTVQRTGSWMLCHALEDTVVAGVPAEYFHRGDERFWATRWRVARDGEYFAAMLREQRSPNGVFGAKVMWNYFDDAVARLKEFSQLSSGSDADILTAGAWRAEICVATPPRLRAPRRFMVESGGHRTIFARR